MHLTLIGAGAAMALSVAAFSLGGRSPAGSPAERSLAALAQTVEEQRAVIQDLRSRTDAARPAEQPAQRRAITATEFQPPELNARLADIQLDVSFSNSHLEDVFKALGTAAGKPVDVRWALLQPSGAEPSTPFTLAHSEHATALGIIEHISESLKLNGGQVIDARLTDDHLVIAPREYFDRMETTLVSYDLSGIIQARMALYNEGREAVVKDLSELLTHFVSPDDWQENGGAVSQMQFVGDRLFVKAPARMHPQIRWMLDQLPVQPSPQAAAAGGAGKEVRMYHLRNAPAQDVARVLANAFPTYRIDVDPRTNTVIVSGADLAAPESVLRYIDSDKSATGGVAVSAEKDATTVFVSGLVKRQGVFQMSPGLTLRQLITAAGGLENGASEVVITHAESGKASITHGLSATSLQDPAGEDPKLLPGDQIVVR